MDFSYLISISGGDKEFISEFISTVEETTYPAFDKMKAHLTSGNFKELGNLAHQIKPTIEMLGMSTFETIVEINTKPETATSEKIDQVHDELILAVKQIKEQLL